MRGRKKRKYEVLDHFSHGTGHVCRVHNDGPRSLLHTRDIHYSQGKICQALPFI
jgi:hypothetical protein